MWLGKINTPQGTKHEAYFYEEHMKFENNTKFVVLGSQSAINKPGSNDKQQLRKLCRSAQHQIMRVMKPSCYAQRQIMRVMKPSCHAQRQIMRAMKACCSVQRQII